MSAFTRRDFIKAITASMAVTGIPPIIREVSASETRELRWQKAPCRFCGVGCSVLVGVRDGRVVAVKGDPESPVNRGLLCIKGYSLPMVLYGADRLTLPMVRKGERFVKVSWDEALDLAARKFNEAIEKYGPSSVAMYISGQSTILEGYAANKLMKGGIGSNNIEANARLCMASAVAAFINTFGMDEPMGCYDDKEYADAFFTWGANMAEMHPVLFSRLLDRKQKHPHVKHVDLTTFSNPTSNFADIKIVFKPNTDLAIANAMAHVIVKEGFTNEDFIRNHVTFKKGREKTGYGLEDSFEFGGSQELNYKTYKPFVDKAEAISYEEYKRFLEIYTPEYAARLSGVPADTIREISRLFADPKRKTMSFWTMGCNQHVRGTWINNLVYNLHLLTGKISQPGNSSFSLTGQPTACGTVREVGTLAHLLPDHTFVTNPEHRKRAAEIWKVPVERIGPKPGYHTMEMFRALDRGEIKVMWVQTTNPFQTLPNADRYRKGARKGERFIIVSDVYPGRTTELADLILPSAMWVEKEGMFGNSERRTQHWFKMVEPPGQAKDDLWQIVELAKRMGLGSLFNYGKRPLQEALFEEYRQFGLGKAKDLAPYAVYTKVRGGLRWPVVDGKETLWRYREGYDPYVKPGEGVRFYGNPDGRAVIWARPYEDPAESPDREYPFWLSTGRVLEHWHTGTMTRRVLELHRAVPYAPVWLNSEDAKEMGTKRGDRVRIISRPGEVIARALVGGRDNPQKGLVFVPFFDEDVLINLTTIDAYCPISKQPDFKKCAVRVEKV